MLALVADIERYPEFVPLCQSLRIRERREKKGREILVADMTVGYKAIRETLTCQVVVDRQASRIDVTYIDGPFEYLNNTWRFEAQNGGGSIIHFQLDYAFKNRALALLMGSMFSTAFARFSKAFEDRADSIYGDGGPALS